MIILSDLKNTNSVQVHIIIISDFPKLKSFKTIRRLITYLKGKNIKINTFFYDNYNDSVLNIITNRLKVNVDCVIISLTKKNLANIIKSDFFKNMCDIRKETKIFIFGAKSILLNLNQNYKEKFYLYERKGVSKTSKKLIEDIEHCIIHLHNKKEGRN